MCECIVCNRVCHCRKLPLCTSDGLIITNSCLKVDVEACVIVSFLTDSIIVVNCL